jgi:hypothetical protein
MVTQDTSVNITEGYGLDGRGSFPGSFQTGSGPPPVSYPIDTWGDLPGVKAAGDVMLITHLRLLPMSGMLELCLNLRTRFHGVVLNYLNTGIILCFVVSVANVT